MQGLTGKLGAPGGEGEEAVVPMVVEGREGTLLTAVGADADHLVAGEALGRLQAERQRTGLGAGSNNESDGGWRGGGALARRGVSKTPAFGCVYEYKTRSGRPVYVGDTDVHPERKFLADARGVDPEVRSLAPFQGVAAEVVWAGVGQGPVGPDEMRVIRRAVRDDRSQRQRVSKLGGIKPYSSHG